MIDTRKFSIPLGLLEAKHVVPLDEPFLITLSDLQDGQFGLISLLFLTPNFLV